MVQLIDTKEVMTLEDADKKYNDKHFLFVFVEEPPLNVIDGKGYVVCIYDEDDRLPLELSKKYRDMQCAFSHGANAYPGNWIGSVKLND